jgi:signal transduction histidine kinase
MDIASRSASLWNLVRRLADRTPLKVRLIATLLALVAVALAVISVTGINYLRSYLLNQQNQQLQSEADSLLLQNSVQNYLAAELAGGGNAHHESTRVAADWLVGGKLYHVIYPVSGYSDIGIPEPVPGPRYSTKASWLAADEPVVVGAQSGSGRWDVTSAAMVVMTSKGPVDGTLIVGIDISSVYNTLNNLAGMDLYVSILLLAGLLTVGILVIQGTLRPLTRIKQTAEAVSAGDFARRVPGLHPRTEVGNVSRSVNKMLGHLETAFRVRSSSEHEARRSQERMRRLVADASHELRTPLTAIRGFAEYLRHRTGLSSRPADADELVTLATSDLESIVGRVEQESERMAAVLEDMLLLTRLDQDDALDSCSLDLLTVVEAAVREARLTAPGCGISLETGALPDTADLMVCGDQARLRQVITILMRNALSRAPAGTDVEVKIGTASRADIRRDLAAAETEPDSWPGPPAAAIGADTDETGDRPAAALLTITDYGRSLTEGQLAHAFEGFSAASQSPADWSQGNRSPARQAGAANVGAGSSLNLAIAAALVRAHGGVVWVRPPVGKGATYCVALPLAGTEDAQADPVAEIAAQEAIESAGPAGLHLGPGMTVSHLTASVGPEHGGAATGGAQPGGARRNGAQADGTQAGSAQAGSAQAGSSANPGGDFEPGHAAALLDSGPVDEVSFLAISCAKPPGRRRSRLPGRRRRIGTCARAAGAAGAAGHEPSSHQKAPSSPDNWPGSGQGRAPRIAGAWPDRSPGGRRGRPGRPASPGRLTTGHCPTSSPRGSGSAFRLAPQAR